MGGGESTIEINKDLYDVSIDPQMIVAQMQLVDRGLIAANDVRDYLRSTNIIKEDRTNDEIEAEAETAPIM